MRTDIQRGATCACITVNANIKLCNNVRYSEKVTCQRYPGWTDILATSKKLQS